MSAKLLIPKEIPFEFLSFWIEDWSEQTRRPFMSHEILRDLLWSETLVMMCLAILLIPRVLLFGVGVGIDLLGITSDLLVITKPCDPLLTIEELCMLL